MILLNLKTFLNKFYGNLKNFLQAPQFLCLSECILNSNKKFSRFSKINIFNFYRITCKFFEKILYFNYFLNVLKSCLNKVPFYLRINLKI